MDLQNFPFDTQNMIIKWIWTEEFHTIWNRIKFVPFHVRACGALRLDLEISPIQEWNMYTPIVEFVTIIKEDLLQKHFNRIFVIVLQLCIFPVVMLNVKYF